MLSGLDVTVPLFLQEFMEEEGLPWLQLIECSFVFSHFLPVLPFGMRTYNSVYYIMACLSEVVNNRCMQYMRSYI
jgi:hypothetical protein